MDIGLLLIILGLILAVLVHLTLGVLLIVIGVILLFVPRVRR
jgi:hypothetical protein